MSQQQMPFEGGTGRWRRVAFVGLAAGAVMLAAGAVIAVSVGSPADPNLMGVILAAIGFVSLFAGGLSLFNILMFHVMRRLQDLRRDE